MKKIIILLLAVSIILGGCQKKLNGQEIYDKTMNAMKEVNSATIDLNMNIKIASTTEENEEGTSFNLPIKMNMALEGINTDDMKTYTETSVSFFNQTTTLKQWFMDDSIYTSEGDHKYVIPAETEDIDAEDLYKFDLNLDEEIVASLNEDNKYVLDVKITQEQFNKLMSEMTDLESLIDQPFEINLKEDIKAQMIINDSYLMEAASFSFIINIDGLGDLQIDLSMTYKDLNNTTLPELNKEEFVGYDDQTIYGAYDITSADIEALKALGYVSLGDNMYSNGDFYIDLNYKQFYTTDMTFVYDWQYDQGFTLDEEGEIACQYNFLTGENDCEGQNIQSIKDAFIELAKGIKE